MALRFENHSKPLLGRLNALICTYVFKSMVGACMFRPAPFQFTFLHVYFVRLDFQFLSLTGVVMRCQPYGCIWNALYYFCSLVSTTHKDLVLRLTAQQNRWITLLVYNYIQQPWVNEGNARRVRLGLVFKGSLLKCCEVYCAVVYGSTQTIRVVSQIYRERTIEEVSANEEGLTSSNLIKLIG